MHSNNSLCIDISHTVRMHNIYLIITHKCCSLRCELINTPYCLAYIIFYIFYKEYIIISIDNRQLLSHITNFPWE